MISIALIRPQQLAMTSAETTMSWASGVPGCMSKKLAACMVNSSYYDVQQKTAEAARNSGKQRTAEYVAAACLQECPRRLHTIFG
jgi:hypothetical protein